MASTSDGGNSYSHWAAQQLRGRSRLLARSSCVAARGSRAAAGDAGDYERNASGLHPPFVHLVVTTVTTVSGRRVDCAPHWRVITPPHQAPLARVRVIVFRSVIT